MGRYLLDSSAIIEMLEGSAKGRNIAKLIQNSELLTNVICFCEVLNKTSLNKHDIAEEFLSNLLILPVTIADGTLAKEYQYDCRKRGGQVATSDCLIAATASNQDAEIVTADSDFSRIEGVKKHVF